MLIPLLVRFRASPRVFGSTIVLASFWFDFQGASAAGEAELSASWSRAGESLRFESLDRSVGGRSVAVSDIVQDSMGFLWFATSEGAGRFDGYRMRTFAHDNADPETLVNSVALVFHIDERERLWIGTEKGVSRYLADTESFANYLLDAKDLNSNLANHVNAIVRDSKNRIYASSESGYIYRYDEASDRFLALNGRPLGIIKSMVIDSRDRVWVGALAEVYRFDPDSGELLRFADWFREPDSSAKNFIESLHYESDERIWVGTATQGTALLNSLEGTLRFLPATHPDERYAHCITRDRYGNVWIGNNGGLVYIDAVSGEQRRFEPRAVEGSLPQSAVRSLLVDDQDNVWIGSASHGIHVSIRNKGFNRFDQYSSSNPSQAVVISSLLLDRAGNLWVGRSSSGIDLYRQGSKDPIEIRPDASRSDSLSPNTVWTIYEDSLGEIWVGTYRGGLQRYVPETGGFETYRYEPGNPGSLASDDVRTVQEDEKGNLWVITHGNGVCYFDRATKSFTRYARDASDPGDSLVDDWAFSLLYSSKGELYVGTAVGLSVLDPASGRFTTYTTDPADAGSLSNPVVNALFEDSTGRIWVGTNGGLNLWDAARRRFARFGMTDGLPNPVVNSMIEDEGGHIWIGTNGGLARLDPSSGEFSSFDVGDGLPTNVFHRSAATKGPDGTLFFGQMNGITFFRPDSIRVNDRPPRVWISDFKVFNRSIEVVPGESRPNALSKSVLVSDSVALDHEMKVITIEFVALNYIQPRKNQYAYQLVGFDKEWNYVVDRREAIYTNLNPGTYTFQVKASNDDGYWSPEPTRLQIVVLPPFWRTLWFRALAICGAILVPASLFYWRHRRTKAKKALLESKVAERTQELSDANVRLQQAYRQLESSQQQIRRQNEELIIHRRNLEAMVQTRTHELEMSKERAERSDLLKSAFLANMSHEIRTPMNAIMGLLELMRQERLSPEERDRYHGVIKQSGQTLIKLIDDILDLSRIEAGEATLQIESVNVDEVCEELYALFVEVIKLEHASPVSLVLERDGHVGITLPVERRCLVLEFDAVRLKQILTNLLSNAVKFTERGEVRFGYRLERSGDGSRAIRFFVRDTGIGIPADQLERIFDRFMKLERKTGRRYRGTGLGLTISQRFAEMMGGKIEVESVEGQGTKFSVVFPVSIDVRGRSNPESDRSQFNGGSNRNLMETDLSAISILVAEDEEPNYLFIRKTLELTGAKVTWAMDGERAIELFEADRFDIILLDLKMPRKDGYAVLKHVRAIDPFIPVVAQTAYAMDSDREKARRGGVTDFLSKPYTPDQLIAKVLGNLRGVEY